MADPAAGAEAIQAGILRMCQQLAAVQAVLQQEPHNAAAATLFEHIIVGIQKNQAVLFRKHGVRLEVLPKQTEPERSSTSGDDAANSLDFEASATEEDEEDKEDEEDTDVESSSSVGCSGAPAHGQESDSQSSSHASQYAPGWWTKGDTVAARPDWSGPLMQAEGFASWTATTNGVALRLMQAMGFQEGRGLGLHEDGIAFPLQPYHAPRSGRAVGLGHAQRQPPEKADGGEAVGKKRKRRQRKSSVDSKATKDGSRMFSLVNQLSKARDGDEGKEKALDTRIAVKRDEYRTYRTLSAAELQRMLANKLRAKDQLANEIRLLATSLSKGGTAAHHTSASMGRKQAVLRTVSQDLAVLTQLMSERARQQKSLAF